MNKSFSLTLNFGKEDEDLWQYLFPLSQEEREGIIKKALHQYVGDILAAKNVKEDPSQGSWGLEALFVPPPENIGNDPQNNPPSTLSDQSLQDVSATPASPLNHLFQLIGDEDDHEVLEFFRSGPKINHLQGSDRISKVVGGAKASNSIEGLEPKAEQIEFPNQPILKVGSKGLDFVLNQVIGEEEDPEVLNFFQKRSKVGE